METSPPHGDTSIHDVPTRIAQDPATHEPLCDEHGNLGPIGDGPGTPGADEDTLTSEPEGIAMEEPHPCANVGGPVVGAQLPPDPGAG